MSSFLNRLAFGFLMAQLLPGFVVLYVAAILAVAPPQPASLLELLAGPLSVSRETSGVAPESLFLLACLAVGMVLHGIHWTLIAYLEEYTEHKRIYRTFWCDLPLVLQVILGPVKLFVELVGLAFCTRDLESLLLEENAPRIPPDRVEAFQFLQGFYLHFAQFYAHGSMALSIAFLTLLAFLWLRGLPEGSLILLVLVYLCAGLFFVIGRIQLGTLFKAEYELTPGGSNADSQEGRNNQASPRPESTQEVVVSAS